ncbi:hypothetical protein OXIME_000248 [Oxyplasma meridianum]|uniref:Uncharacterized protein n=1 Tax=Oxyplasma meridianum TaxID=3073602 RepID=A0AAX4NDY3_9ARCH
MLSKFSASRFAGLRWMGLGVLYMVVALIAQEVIQSLPAIIFLFYHGFDVTYLIDRYPLILKSNYILYAIFIGGVAGLFQEGATYIAVDTRKKKAALFIGLGFAVVDIVFLVAETLFGAEPVSRFQSFLIFLNIVSSLMFHPGTATFMKWGWLVNKGRITLLLSILIHAVDDGGLVYVDYYIGFQPNLYHVLAYEYWAMVMVISVAIFVMGISLLRKLEDTEIQQKPVVY